MGWAGAVTVGLALVVALAGLPLYVFPPQEAPSKSDVIFVIGPADRWRLDWAEGLIQEGLSDNLMISVGDPSWAPECTEDRGFRILCRRSDPFTTQGEARWLRDEMRENGWTTATVITMTPHVSRTRVRMDRCVPTGVNVIGRADGLSPTDWAWQYLYQTAGFVKVVLQPTC